MGNKYYKKPEDEDDEDNYTEFYSSANNLHGSWTEFIFSSVSEKICWPLKLQ